MRAPRRGMARCEKERKQLLRKVVIVSGVCGLRDGEVGWVDCLKFGTQKVEDADGRPGVEIREIPADYGVDEESGEEEGRALPAQGLGWGGRDVGNGGEECCDVRGG